MKRITIAGVAAVIAAALAAFIVSAGGAAAAPTKGKTGTFRQVLSSKLGAQLHKPSEDVLAALKAAAPSKSERQARRKGEKPSEADRAKRKQAWTASMATSLGVEPSAVTAAVQALVKQRLDSLVADGWLTADQAAKRADKLGIAFLRVGGR
jgi:hypothetical protein